MNSECVKILLQNGAEVDNKTNKDETRTTFSLFPLPLSFSHISVPSLLLILYTALFLASGKGHTSCVKLLLDSKANPNIQNIDGLVIAVVA